jgi:putative phosphoserine phosphatase/1-acylglycerol-3-phosphate O-acyltransferase
MSRIADLTATIDASPAGATVGAFFDFDGTLLGGYSAMILMGAQLRRRELSPLGLVHSTMRGAAAMKSGGMEQAIADGMAAMAGKRHDQLVETAVRDYAAHLAPRMHSEALALLAAHLRQRHTVVIASSATNYQIEPAARALGVDHVLCTRLEVDADGVATGRVDGPVLWGPYKAVAVADFAKEHGIDLDQSFAYSDGSEDQPMLELVGNPTAINPGKKLAERATLNGWPIRRFSSRRRVGWGDVGRGALTVGTLGPLAVSAAGIGVVRRDKRAATDLFTRLWPDLALSINGVTLAVTGEEHLHTKGPVVVVFNHRTLLDEIVVARLLRRNFVMVLGDHYSTERAVSVIGRRLGVVINDGDHVRSSTAVAEVVASGRSVAIALPEFPPGSIDVAGTGSRALRLARDSGVPVVPVMVHDAGDLQRVAGVLRPGSVSVDVGPVISVSTLDEDLAGARKQLARALRPHHVAAAASRKQG